MDVQIKQIGPVEAAELLEQNIANRQLRSQYVDQLARQMLDGHWKMVGDPIRVDTTGRLLDGQHRLNAIVASKTAQEFVVVRDLDPMTQAVMDTGLRRRFSDMLKMAGENNALTLAAVTRVVHMRRNGYSYPEMAAGSIQFGALELQKTLDAHPELRDAAREGHKGGHAIKIPPAFVGLGWWEFGNIDADDRDEFFRLILNKSLDRPNEPVAKLRMTMLEAAASSRAIPRLMKFALFIKTWNHFRDGVEVKNLRWRRHGSAPESFPTPY